MEKETASTKVLHSEGLPPGDLGSPALASCLAPRGPKGIISSWLFWEGDYRVLSLPAQKASGEPSEGMGKPRAPSPSPGTATAGCRCQSQALYQLSVW